MPSAPLPLPLLEAPVTASVTVVLVLVVLLLLLWGSSGAARHRGAGRRAEGPWRHGVGVRRACRRPGVWGERGKGSQHKVERAVCRKHGAHGVRRVGERGKSRERGRGHWSINTATPPV